MFSVPNKSDTGTMGMDPILTLVTATEFQQLETKVEELSQKLGELATWILTKFGHEPSFPSNLNELFGFKIIDVVELSPAPGPNLQSPQTPATVKSPLSSSSHQRQRTEPIKVVFHGQVPVPVVPVASPNRSVPSPSLRSQASSAITSPSLKSPAPFVANPFANPSLKSPVASGTPTLKSPAPVPSPAYSCKLDTITDLNLFQLVNENEELVPASESRMPGNPVESKLSDKEILAKHPEIKPSSVLLMKLNIPPEYMEINGNSEPYPKSFELNFPCEDCGKLFSNEESKSHHQRLHIAKKPYLCQICLKRFHFQSELQAHEESGDCGREFIAPTNSNTPDFPCPFCRKTFAHVVTRNLHVKSVHSAEEVEGRVAVGNGQVYHYQTLKTFCSIKIPDHVEDETDTKDSQCPICNKSFAQRSSLKNHLLIHTGERPFKCDVCGKGFTQLVHRNKHLSTHSSEKQFTCKECGRGFALKCQMEKHFAIHTGIRPY